MKKTLPYLLCSLILIFSLFINVLFVNAANGWTETQPEGDVSSGWKTSSMSDDGQTMIIAAAGGRLYVTTNGGTNWIEKQPAGNTDQTWRTVSVSGDGETMIAGVEFARLYISTDGGDNFTETQPLGDNDSRWRSSGISDDGQVIYVGTDRSGGYLSTDGGDTWNLEMPPSVIDGVFFGAAVSGDGQSIVLGDYDENEVYLTNNQGSSWSTMPIGVGNESFESVAISDNGQVILAGENNGRLYRSTNGGANWSEVRPKGEDQNYNWEEVAMSDNGSVMLAVNGEGIYFSENSGADWSEADPSGDSPESWSTVAIDDDASNSLAARQGGRVWLTGDLIAQSTPAPISDSSSQSSNSSHEVYQHPSTTDTPTCNDSAPTKAPKLFQLDAAGTYANVYFETIIDGTTGYRIEYGTNNEANQHSDTFAHQGPQWTLGRTINYLQPNTTYYFKVHALNGCNSGPWSEIKSTKTHGQLANVNQWFANLNPFTQKTTQISQVPSNVEGTVAGVSTEMNNCEHTFISGESLWGIARWKMGSTQKLVELLELNPGIDPLKMQHGQKIKLCN